MVHIYLMKKAISLILVLLVALLGVKGWRIFAKVRHAKRLKIGVEKFKLLNLSLSPSSTIVLTIGNYSPSTFIISQIHIEVYTKKGLLLAEQKEPLVQPITLTPNQNTPLPLSYRINAQVVITALTAIGGLSSVAANYITSGKYGLPVVLKGFVEADHIQIPIEESITI